MDVNNEVAGGRVRVAPIRIPDPAPPDARREVNASGAPMPRSEMRIPLGDRVSSMLGRGPIPWGKISAAKALVREAARGTGADETGTLSPMEAGQRRGVVGKAQKALDAAVDGPIEKTMKSLRAVFVQTNVVEKQLAEAENQLLRGPDGELISRDQARATQDEIHASIRGADGSGVSLRHQRKRQSKARGIVLMSLDFPVFLWMMLGILNVSVAAVMYGDAANVVKAVLAVTLALVGTVVLALVMRSFGRRHRMFKGDSGAIEAAGPIRRRIRAELAAIGFVLIVAALLMGARMVEEAQRAGAPPVLAYFLAGLMAALIALAAYLNYAATFDDGSIVTDRLDYLAFVQASHDSVVLALRGALALLLENAGLVMTQLDRQLTEARTNAIHQVTRSSADGAIRVARSYSGSRAPLPEPELDFTRLELAERQARQHKEHWIVLGAINGIPVAGIEDSKEIS